MGTPPAGAGRSRTHPAYEWDRPTRTPTARITPYGARLAAAPAAHPADALRVQERRRGAEAVNCCLALAEATFCGLGCPSPDLGRRSNPAVVFRAVNDWPT